MMDYTKFSEETNNTENGTVEVLEISEVPAESKEARIAEINEFLTMDMEDESRLKLLEELRLLQGEEVEEIKALDECTRDELVEVAIREGIEVTEDATREELIEAININREEVMDELINEVNSINEEEIEEPEEVEEDILPAVISGCTKVNIRKEASKTSEVVCVLANGTEVTIDVAKSTEEFYKIYTVSGETLIEGYCIKDFVSINIK